MEKAEAAVAQCAALIVTLQAIIHSLPPEVAAEAAKNLREAALRVDAISNAMSRLSDEALEEQAATFSVMVSALEHRASVTGT